MKSLYNHNTSFNDKFSQPTSEYRGTPFWSWNSDLDEATLEKQIEIFHEMGFGGFHIHSRIGLNTPYLGPRFMQLVEHCNTVGKKLGMLTWLYDEDKWPSGFAGGLVTQHEEFRIRYLLFSPILHEDGYVDRHLPQASRVNMNGDCSYLCSYEVTLEQGRLSSYKKVEKGTSAQEGTQIWHAYRVISGASSWFNNQSYVDTLNPEAAKEFTRVTHDVYAATLKEELGKSVPAMFTDEPQYFKLQNFSCSESNDEVGIPFTDTFDESYQQVFGESLFDKLPELFWESTTGAYPVTRYRYFEILTERFTSAYCDVLDDWCTSHGILSTGHLMGESTLDLQSRLCGEAMRSYRSFKLPGIDMLADRREYATAKQAQSACHQFGYPGVLSELYGVTNWDFDFRGHKLQGDWQAALGVTVRVHHLCWATMAGESKRDYPAPIDQHSTWYKEYRTIEDHFSRVNVALTTGKPRVRIGVLHPIESYWLTLGPDDATIGIRKQLEEQFTSITSWLLFAQLDYDFVAESLLPKLFNGCDEKSCHIGEMNYEVLVVPQFITIRSTTLAILKEFIASGGKVIFLGGAPSYVDGQKSDVALEATRDALHIGFDQWALLNALDTERDVAIYDGHHTLCNDLIYQMRNDGKRTLLFIAHGRESNRMQQQNFRSDEDFTRMIKVRGLHSVTLLDTFTGNRIELEVDHKQGWTHFSYPLHVHDSLLFELSVEKELNNITVTVDSNTPRLLQKHRIREISSYQLHEQNHLLLDQAAYSLDGGSWNDVEEMLILDDAIRSECGYPIRSEAFPQPWLVPDEETLPHKVQLRFDFESEIDGVMVSLACETPDAEIVFNGNAITESLSGNYFVDPCLPVRKIGTVKRGNNTLEMNIPYGKKTNLEWCYLLGDFGVRLLGSKAMLCEKPHTISFGDITRQGFPFYGDSITYVIRTQAEAGRWLLKVPQYKGSLLTVSLDGNDKGQIIGEPYTIDLGLVDNQSHTIEITCFGNRFNTFGQLHNCNAYEAYFGPKAWRSAEEKYSYVYQVRSAGILTEPWLEIRES